MGDEDEDYDYAEGCGDEDYEGDYDYEEEEEKVDNMNSTNQTYLACEHGLFKQDNLDYLIKKLKGKIESIVEENQISQGKALLIFKSNQYNLNTDSSISCEMLDTIFPSEKLPESLKKSLECLLCGETLEQNQTHSLLCNHKFCYDCFSGYTKACLAQGREILFKTCPMEGCEERMGFIEFEKFLNSEKEKALITKFLLQDAIMEGRGIVQCPSSECDQVFSSDFTKKTVKAVNMKCTKCERYFCNVCSEDAHLPCKCEMLKQWQELIEGKSQSSSDMSQTWLKLNTKPCPKCKVHIEKNQGCMHMKCFSCGFHFCWLCLGEYVNHESFYSCNKYTPEQQKVSVEEANLKKYTFFSDRFRDHLEAVKYTQNEAKTYSQTLQQGLKMIGENEQKQSQFYVRAFEVLIEAKKGVAYSYPIGFYIRESRREYFEFLQGELEQNLNLFEESLTVVEFDLLLASDEQHAFYSYRQKILEKTESIKKYLCNMLEDLSSELPQLVSIASVKKNSKILKKNESIRPKQKPKTMCIICHQLPAVNNEFCLCVDCLAAHS